MLQHLDHGQFCCGQCSVLDLGFTFWKNSTEEPVVPSVAPRHIAHALTETESAAFSRTVLTENKREV